MTVPVCINSQVTVPEVFLCFIKLTNKTLPCTPALAWFQPSVSHLFKTSSFIIIVGKDENRPQNLL